MRAEDLEMTAGDRGGDGVGPGLDAVGDQIVAGVVEGIHPLHQNPMRPDTLDARSHRGQAEREVADFGIARRVQDLGFTPCEDRRHQGRLGRSHGWRGQYDAAAAQPVAFGPRMNVTGLDVDVGPERVQRLEMQIDRPRADRAASRQRHARRTETGQQRRQDENAGAHAADHVVGRLRVAGCRWRPAPASAQGRGWQLRRTRASGRAWCRRPSLRERSPNSSRSELSSAAAICGRAAFFAPQIWTEPSMRLPPRMTNRSMLFLFRRKAISEAALRWSPDTRRHGMAADAWVFGVL